MRHFMEVQLSAVSIRSMLPVIGVHYLFTNSHLLALQRCDQIKAILFTKENYQHLHTHFVINLFGEKLHFSVLFFRLEKIKKIKRKEAEKSHYET